MPLWFRKCRDTEVAFKCPVFGKARNVTNRETATLLVVEDEPLIRLDMVSLLEQRGFAVLEAANADEAIDILTRNSEIRAVLSDIDMPGSMNGIALVHAISKRWPPCRLILVSGMSAPRPEELPDRTYFIPKPVSAAVLDRTLIALDLGA